MARTKTKPENGNGSTLGFEAKLWLAADKLRNNLDAAEYKHVVLGLIFLKYTSDAFEEQHAMEIPCRKSRVGPSFLPEKMRKDEPTPDYAPDTGLRPSIEELERRKAWMLQNGNCKGPGPSPAAEKDAEKLRRPGQSTSRVECGETWMNPP